MFDNFVWKVFRKLVNVYFKLEILIFLYFAVSFSVLCLQIKSSFSGVKNMNDGF